MEKIEIKGSELFKAGFCVAAGVSAWKLTDVILNAVAKGIVEGIKKAKRDHSWNKAERVQKEYEEVLHEESNV